LFSVTGFVVHFETANAQTGAIVPIMKTSSFGEFPGRPTITESPQDREGNMLTAL
jgi:hypothetical protein